MPPRLLYYERPVFADTVEEMMRLGYVSRLIVRIEPPCPAGQSPWDYYTRLGVLQTGFPDVTAEVAACRKAHPEATFDEVMYSVFVRTNCRTHPKEVAAAIEATGLKQVR